MYIDTKLFDLKLILRCLDSPLTGHSWGGVLKIRILGLYMYFTTYGWLKYWSTGSFDVS